MIKLRRIPRLLLGLCAMCALFATSCQDKVDESNMYTFKADLVTSYIAKQPELSKFYYLMQKVRLGDSPSTIDQLLSARGNYTCFIPTNNAVQNHIDSIYGTTDYDITQLPDSVAETMVRNAIIDNENNEAYQTADFVIGTLDKENMNNRYLTVDFDTIEGGKAAIYISTNSLILVPDIEVSNGYIHVVDHVINPSASTLPDLIAVQDNLLIFSHLLKVTGWDEQMKAYRDLEYEERAKSYPTTRTGGITGTKKTPKYRNFGYTAFVEPDSLLISEWGLDVQRSGNAITNWEDVMAKIDQVCRAHYPEATSNDLTSEQNAINQFVSYHLLDAAVPYNKLVLHYGEVGYAYTRPEQLGIDKMQYFEVLGKPRRMLKITEGSQTNGKRINRYVSEYDKNTYRELQVPILGTEILGNNGGRVIAALNGYYYPITEVLWYSDDVVDKVLNERIRVDVNSLQPELMTNGYRGMKVDGHYWMPPGYQKNVQLNDEALYGFYVNWGQEGNLSFEQDEPFIEGQFDVRFRLMPVPYEGTYELRICYATDPTRGMVQVYVGNNPNNLPAAGLPIDMRIRANGNPNVYWIYDTNDQEQNRENDRIMKLHGYMKCPACFGYPSKVGAGATARDGEGGIKLRQIVWTGNMKPNETYYIRFKQLLTNPSAFLDLDFFELVPKSVFDGVEQEDIW